MPDDGDLYQYKATVLKAYDGDTCTLSIDVGFHISIEEQVRLYGIDTPEMRSNSSIEKDMARAARDELRKLVNKEVTIITHKQGKYGRYLVDIYYGDEHINKKLIDMGLAREYYGGKKEPWF